MDFCFKKKNKRNNLDNKFVHQITKTLKPVNLLNISFFCIKFYLKLIGLFIKNIFFSKKNSKEINNVQIDYDNIWSSKSYFPNLQLNKNTYLKFKNNYYISSSWHERKFFYIILCSVIELNKIDTVLEVGCGNGVLINCLSRKYKNVNFHGIDLTKKGIRLAKSLKKKKTFKKLSLFFDKDINLGSPKNLTFKQESVLNLKEELKFSLVFTTLALEQMKNIQFDAIKKITNVSNNLIVLIEPFVFYNKSFISRNYHKLKNYFNLERKEFEINGFKIYSEFDLPSKIYRRVGVLILKKESRNN